MVQSPPVPYAVLAERYWRLDYWVGWKIGMSSGKLIKLSLKSQK